MELAPDGGAVTLADGRRLEGRRVWSTLPLTALAAMARPAPDDAALAAAAALRRVTPYASGSFFVDGQLQVVGSDADHAGRSRRLAGLLVDRDFGIAAWQPAWLLLAPALGALAVRRPRGAAALVLPLAAGWLVAAFVALTMQGWWFPGRQLLAVLPLGVPAVAWWARDGGRRLWAVLALGAAGVVAQAWVAVEASRGAITWVVTLQDTANPLYRAWRLALPDYLHVTATTWALHWAWTAVLLGAAALAYRAAPDRSGAPATAAEAPVGASP